MQTKRVLASARFLFSCLAYQSVELPNWVSQSLSTGDNAGVSRDGVVGVDSAPRCEATVQVPSRRQADRREGTSLWGRVADTPRTMGSLRVVALAPTFHDYPRLVQRRERVVVESINKRHNSSMTGAGRLVVVMARHCSRQQLLSRATQARRVNTLYMGLPGPESSDSRLVTMRNTIL